MSKITNKNFNVHNNIYCVNCKRRTGGYKRNTKWPIIGIVIGVLFIVPAIIGFIFNLTILGIIGIIGMLLLITISSIKFSKQKKDNTYKCGMCHSRVTVDPSTVTSVDNWEDAK